MKRQAVEHELECICTETWPSVTNSCQNKCKLNERVPDLFCLLPWYKIRSYIASEANRASFASKILS